MSGLGVIKTFDLSSNFKEPDAKGGGTVITYKVKPLLTKVNWGYQF